MRFSSLFAIGVGTAIVTIGLAPQTAFAQVTVGKNGLTTTAVHIAGPTMGSIDYYGSGNDDAFAEYGMTTWNFTAGDFGLAVANIVSAELTLTVNDRSFSDGSIVEFFFTPDTAAVLGGGFASLSFDSNFTNGINGAQYVNAPVSLGSFAITEMAGRAGGEIDVFNLNIGGGVATAMVNAINSGTNFQIIVAATVSSHDITYSGVGNTFDPGDPNLEITANLVPEPATLTVLALGAAALLRRRKKS